MNTDKTLNNKFAQKRNEYPVWYYKELKPIDIDYVIAYLLKDTFVVDIGGSKHEITFGYNNKENFIGQSILYDDIKNSNLTSYKVIQQGFKSGQWYIITEKDTTEEYKINYRNEKDEYVKKKTSEFYRKCLKNSIDSFDISKDKKTEYKKTINNLSYEDLEMYMSTLFNKNI